MQDHRDGDRRPGDIGEYIDDHSPDGVKSTIRQAIDLYCPGMPEVVWRKRRDRLVWYLDILDREIQYDLTHLVAPRA